MEGQLENDAKRAVRLQSRRRKLVNVERGQFEIGHVWEVVM